MNQPEAMKKTGRVTESIWRTADLDEIAIESSERQVATFAGLILGPLADRQITDWSVSASLGA